MKVSVITICYNAEESIEKTIKSILEQEFTDYEYIVVDGKSKDNTNYIINTYKPEFEKIGINVIHVSEKDKGIYDAMNKGVRLSSGDWLCFMNSGDKFANSQVLRNVFCEDVEAYGVIYGDVIWSLGELEKENKAKEPEFLLEGMPFCHQSSFVKREMLEENPYDLDYKICADYKLFLTLYKKGIEFKKINFPFSVFDSEGVSYTNIVGLMKEKYQIQDSFGILDCKSFEVKCVLARLKIRQLIRKCVPKSIAAYVRKSNFSKH